VSGWERRTRRWTAGPHLLWRRGAGHSVDPRGAGPPVIAARACRFCLGTSRDGPGQNCAGPPRGRKLPARLAAWCAIRRGRLMRCGRTDRRRDGQRPGSTFRLVSASAHHLPFSTFRVGRVPRSQLPRGGDRCRTHPWSPGRSGHRARDGCRHPVGRPGPVGGRTGRVDRVGGGGGSQHASMIASNSARSSSASAQTMARNASWSVDCRTGMTITHLCTGQRKPSPLRR